MLNQWNKKLAFAVSEKSGFDYAECLALIVHYDKYGLYQLANTFNWSDVYQSAEHSLDYFDYCVMVISEVLQDDNFGSNKIDILDLFTTNLNQAFEAEEDYTMIG